MNTSQHPIPEIHFHNLAQIERQYWWHISRLNWAETLINSQIPYPSKRHALDFGCGTGGFLHLINERIQFKSRLGVDTSPVAIEAARKFGEHYQQITSNDFSYVEGRDLVFLMDTLEHIEHDTVFLKHLFQPLAMGAFVLICVPAMPRLYSSWDLALGHYRRYGKHQLSHVISMAGGHVKWIRYIFSYLVPAMLIKRNWKSQQFNSSNCEFPPVSQFLNKTLLTLNHVEIKTANRMEIPFGSSLICLVEL